MPPEGSETHPANTFTLIVETLTGTCGAKCNANPITETQSLSFELQGPLASASRVALWCSSESAVFAKQPDVAVAKGMLRLSMKPDTICTATTLLVRYPTWFSFLEFIGVIFRFPEMLQLVVILSQRVY